jgi:hypothetical protein
VPAGMDHDIAGNTILRDEFADTLSRLVRRLGALSLDVNSDRLAVVKGKVHDLEQRWNHFSVACIEPSQLLQEVTADPTAPVGRRVKDVIVKYDELPIFAEMDIAFDGVCPMIETRAKGAEGVFRSYPGGAGMTDHVLLHVRPTLAMKYVRPDLRG